jgi:hypothetical protein
MPYFDGLHRFRRRWCAVKADIAYVDVVNRPRHSGVSITAL